MKIAILAESFLPHMNGVTGSILQAVKHLTSRGHDILIIAPDAGPITEDLHGAQLKLLRSMPYPGYSAVRIVSATAATITRLLREYQPDVVHLASPFVLGWAGVRAAAALGMPTVAVYQTDVASFAARYGMPRLTTLAASHITRLHRRATLTLAPSSSAEAALSSWGVDRLRRWGRGVDADRFAPERRDETWRSTVSDGKVIVGYAGRLSPEKQVEDLKDIAEMPGVQLVIVGDGPSRASLEELMPSAHFTGFQGGTDLARALASFDVFVHPGEAETFCQGIQEALASGAPVVATGAGGPLDLVENSVTGWLYEPGNLQAMRAAVVDLVGDRAKREAFARSARRAVVGRSWAALTDQLEGYYREAIELQRIDAALLTRPPTRPRNVALAPREPALPRWKHYVALGDSITEGLGDRSRMPSNEFYGWATRLGMLLASVAGDEGIQYANLSVRSRKVHHMAEQVDRAIELQADLTSMLIGSNDLVGARVNIPELARELERQVARLRAEGIDVLLGTPFLPRRVISRVIAKRFATFNSHIRRIALEHNCLLIDTETIPEISDLHNWCDDRVHLASSGHRILAYRAAAVLGVPDAEVLSSLEVALHEEEYGGTGNTIRWFRAHALPWMWRRLRGRTAGDGRTAMYNDYIALTRGGISA